MIKEYGYEYDAVLNKKMWKKAANRVTYELYRGAICLRSGRDALKVIAREYKPTNVYLPALSCDSMVRPFKIYGYKVKFYKYNSDYSINLESLHELIRENSDSGLFIYMNYFGIESIAETDLETLKHQYSELIFIEDRTHDLFEVRNNQFHPDFIIASLRKWINIPDGALLWAKQKLTCNDFGEDTKFMSKRLEAQCMRNEYLNTGNEMLKCKYRKIFSKVSDIMDNDSKPSRMSEYSYQLISNTEWNKILYQRKSNAERLSQMLLENNIKVLQSNSNIRLYVPIFVENRDDIQKRLSKIGVFNTIIWPLSDVQKNKCEIAKFTEEHMLAAPCDQRYTEEDMEFIGYEIIKSIQET